MPRTKKPDKSIAPDIFNDKNYHVCVRNITRSGNLYFISRGLHGDSFRLYRQIDSGYELISESNSPTDFDDLIPWDN